MGLPVIICLDIGGSHITAAAVHRENDIFIPIRKDRGEVDSMADRKQILATWDRVIRSVVEEQNQNIEGFFVSMPGPFDYERGICLMDGMHKYQSLLHMDVKSHFSTTFDVPCENIYFLNDAEAFLLGEIHHHNLGAKRVVGLTLGTGLGSAIYEHRQVRDLNYGSAPFREGIAEDYISTRGILTYVERLGLQRPENVKALLINETDESTKSAAFAFLAAALAEFLSTYIAPLQPEGIVLGGSITKAHERFLSAVQDRMSVPLYVASFDEWNLFIGLASTIHL